MQEIRLIEAKLWPENILRVVMAYGDQQFHLSYKYKAEDGRPTEAYLVAGENLYLPVERLADSMAIAMEQLIKLAA